jgi:hypothetical protein
MWLLSRAAAGVVVSILTAAEFALIVFVLTLIPLKSGPGQHLFGGFVLDVFVFLLLVLPGVLPGVLIMWVSQARIAPWRSLPVVLFGTTIGSNVFSFPLTQLPGSNATGIMFYVLYITGFAIGGLVAARFPPSIPV